MKVHSSGYVFKIPLLSLFSGRCRRSYHPGHHQDCPATDVNPSRAPSTATGPGVCTRSDTVSVEAWTTDLQEARTVDEFCASGCGCMLVKGGSCSFQFSKEYYVSARANVAELSWNELNMAVMGQVMALTYSGAMKVISTKHRHAPAERQKTTTLFHHQGHRVCTFWTTFLLLHNMAEGLVPRIHGHTGHIPHNSLVHKDVECIICFVIQYWETNAILLSGRVPGYERDDIQIVPSATTKRSVWRTYCDTCTSLSEWTVAYSTFCKVWRHFLPHCCCTVVDGSLLEVSTEQHCNCS